MNAPAAPAAVTDTAIELIPIGVITPSRTHIQELRRKHFNQESLLELAQSIGRIGVQQPIVVRPAPKIVDNKKYEIVFGERRFLAADRAGLAHVPCIIRELLDEQVLEAQLVENLQREGLNALEEATGYDELHKLKGYNAERIGELIGKSRSYVYARLKLLALCPEATKALDAGEISMSTALVIARFTTPKLQKQALKRLENWGDAEDMSYREAFNALRHDFTAMFDSAPFSLDDGRKSVIIGTTTFAFEHAGCTTCPHNSTNDQDLARERESAHVCTNKPCFELKVQAHWAAKRLAAEQAGQQVLAGKDAQAIIPSEWQGYNHAYLNLDAEAEDMEFPEAAPKDEESPEFIAWEERSNNWRPPTYRALLGVDAPAAVLAEGKNGQLHELVPIKEAAKLLKAKGVKIHVPQRDADDDDGTTDEQRKAEAAREEEKRKVERAYRRRLLREIFNKWKGPLKRVDLERVAEVLSEGYEDSDGALDELYPDVNLAKLKDDELNRYIALNLISGDCSVYNFDAAPKQMIEVAARFRIDTKALRAAVVKELKPTSAPKEEAEGPEKKPAKKKTSKKKA